jgi:hypothetical protein
LTDIPPDTVHAQLDRILASPGFVNAGRLSLVLKLLVGSAIAGDPCKDPIAPEDTRHLRSRLEEYYATAGTDDPVVIELPEDTYIPVFHQRVEATGYQPSVGRKLFMLGLCLAALIGVWVFYFLNK